MTGIEDSLERYRSNYEKVAKEVCEGIDEGLSEGLKKGIQQGFLEGIRECRLTGFDNIEVKGTEEVLKCALNTASDEAVCSIIKQKVSEEYWKKIGPSLKKKMEEACSRVVEEVKNADIELDEKPASYMKSCVNSSIENVTECIGNACSDVKRNFLTDMIFGSFFYCLQSEFNRDLESNLKVCKERICKEIDNKINDKKADHERH